MTKREIKIEQTTLQRLEKLSKPLEDADAVINRVLDEFERRQKPETYLPKEREPESEEEYEFTSEEELPDLTHTRVISASIDGVYIPKPRWRYLLNYALILVGKEVCAPNQIGTIFSLNITTGRKTDTGYAYLRDINISVQAADSNKTCRTLIKATRRLGVKVDIQFQWHAKDGAERPGKFGRIKIEPTG